MLPHSVIKDKCAVPTYAVRQALRAFCKGVKGKQLPWSHAALDDVMAMISTGAAQGEGTGGGGGRLAHQKFPALLALLQCMKEFCELAGSWQEAGWKLAGG
jgi:hypothetical protein